METERRIKESQQSKGKPYKTNKNNHYLTNQNKTKTEKTFLIKNGDNRETNRETSLVV